MLIETKFDIGQEVFFRDWGGQIRNGVIIDISYMHSRKKWGFNCIEYEVEYDNGYDEVESDWFSETIIYYNQEKALPHQHEDKGE